MNYGESGLPAEDIPKVPSPIISSDMKPYRKNWWRETVRQSLAEFLGDVIFVFIGSMAAGNASGNTLMVAMGHGLTIALIIISIGHISGGHYNPAVTLSVLCLRSIHPVRAAFFIIAQLLGGFVGALLTRLVTSPSQYEDSFNGITTLPNPEKTSIGEAIACEFILTYFLVQTVLSSFVYYSDNGGNILGALAVGFVITVDILAGSTISGASMNPARSFGPSAAASIYKACCKADWNSNPWTYQYVYWAGPIGGAILAALVYKSILDNNQNRWFFRTAEKGQSAVSN